MYQCTRINDTFVVEVVPRPLLTISEDDEKELTATWEHERRRCGDYLYNGKVFSALHFDANGMQGCWISYREALAGHRKPALAERLGILPVAVSGMVWAGEHLLVGQRAEHLAQFPGHWELAPSGGLDPESQRGPEVDFRETLYKELQEETGILPEAIARLHPFALMRGQTALEICLEVQLHAAEPFTVEPTAEYVQFIWVAKDKLFAFFAAGRQRQVVPLSAQLIRPYHQARRG